MSQEILNKFEQLFDDYLDGQLTSIDQTELERALKDYPELQSKLEDHIDARANIRVAGEQNLKNLFLKEFESDSTIEDDTTPLANTGQTSKLPKYGIIALIGLACLLGIYLLLSKDKNSAPAQPLQIAMVEDPSYELLRGDSDMLSVDAWQQAVQSFVKKDYKKTISILNPMNADSIFMSDHIGKYSLMKGVSHLKLKEFESAESALTKISASNPYYDQAEWYLALTPYFNNKSNLTKERLNSIIKSEDHYKRDDAVQLLRHLE